MCRLLQWANFGFGQRPTVIVGFFFAKKKPKCLQSQLILETVNSGFFFIRFFFAKKKSTAVFGISPSVIGEISTVMLSRIPYLKKLAFFSSFVLCYYSTIRILEWQFLCHVNWTCGGIQLWKAKFSGFFFVRFFFRQMLKSIISVFFSRKKKTDFHCTAVSLDDSLRKRMVFVSFIGG